MVINFLIKLFFLKAIASIQRIESLQPTDINKTRCSYVQNPCQGTFAAISY